MPAYNPQDYQIFLDDEYIKNLVNQNLKNFFPDFINCHKIESKYFDVLAETSFLVRYYATFEDKNGQRKTIEIRGNRLNLESYKIFDFLWQTHKYKKYYYPRPLHYFTNEQFVLYENYEGEVYRSWPDKNLKFYNETTPLIADRLADLHKSKIKTTKILSTQSQIQALDALLNKIKNHGQKYFPVANKAANLIKKFFKKNAKRKLALCHNDFQVSNIIYEHQTSQIGIIDFELMGKFFPAADVANFNIQLLSMIKNTLPPKKIIQLQKTFLKEYKKHFNKKWILDLENDLPYFLAKSMIDLIALYCIQVKSEDKQELKNYLNQAMKTHHQNLNKFLTNI